MAQHTHRRLPLKRIMRIRQMLTPLCLRFISKPRKNGTHKSKTIWRHIRRLLRDIKIMRTAMQTATMPGLISPVLQQAGRIRRTLMPLINIRITETFGLTNIGKSKTQQMKPQKQTVSVIGTITALKKTADNLRLSLRKIRNKISEMNIGL